MSLKKAPKLSVVYRKIDQLKPYAANARTHSKRQIKQIGASIRAFGFTNPVLVDRNNRIIAGHGRVEGARLEGMTEVPTICLEDLTDAQVRAYIIADNKLAENAGWDNEILAIELQFLTTLDLPDFDVTITGFEVPEIDLIIEGSKPPMHEEDEVPALSQTAVSQLGDLWLLDKHRILCADALMAESYEQLMGRHKASVIFCDPPYNVRIDGHATGNGKIKHREFDVAAGEMSDSEFQQFLATSLSNLARCSKVGSVHFICMDWRHMEELLSAGKKVYNTLLNLCVWCKDNGGMGSFYRSQHELVFVYRHGKAAYRNNIQLGKFERNRTNIWNYPGIATQSKQGDEGNLLALHPTVKPIAMVADALLDVSGRGDIVLDGFLGSGTTLMAAQRVGRVCYGLEIDPLYVDVAIRRWQRHTGQSAKHAVTGKTFNEIVRLHENPE